MSPKVPIADYSTDWSAVAAALCLGILAALHVGKVPPSLPAIRAELEVGLVGGGFIVSMFNLLGMLLGILMGRCADQIGRRKTALLGCACFILGGGMGALADGLPILLASRAIEGLGFIAIAVTMPSLVADVASKRDRPFALGLWSVFMPVGFAIALLTAPVLLPAFGWRMLWGGLAAISMLAMLYLLPKLRFGAPATQLRAIDVLSQTRLWLLSIAFGTYAFQWVTVMAWLPTYLMDDLGFAIGSASVSTAFVVVANVPGNLLAGSLMRRGVTPGWLIAIGSVGMAFTATGLFLGAATGPLTGLGLCFVLSAFGGLIPSVLFAQIPRLSPTPDYAAQANGMLMQGSATGQFIGPPIVGAAVAATGGAWSGAVAPLIAMALVTVVAGVLSTSPSQKPKLASE